MARLIDATLARRRIEGCLINCPLPARRAGASRVALINSIFMRNFLIHLT